MTIRVVYYRNTTVITTHICYVLMIYSLCRAAYISEGDLLDGEKVSLFLKAPFSLMLTEITEGYSE